MSPIIPFAAAAVVGLIALASRKAEAKAPPSPSRSAPVPTFEAPAWLDTHGLPLFADVRALPLNMRPVMQQMFDAFAEARVRPEQLHATAQWHRRLAEAGEPFTMAAFCRQLKQLLSVSQWSVIERRVPALRDLCADVPAADEKLPPATAPEPTAPPEPSAPPAPPPRPPHPPRPAPAEAAEPAPAKDLEELIERADRILRSKPPEPESPPPPAPPRAPPSAPPEARPPTPSAHPPPSAPSPPPPVPTATVPEGYDPVKARKVAPRLAAHLKKRGIAGYSRQTLKEWQKLAGIENDGIYGGQTAGALRHYLKGTGVAPPRPFFKPVKEIPYTPPG